MDDLFKMIPNGHECPLVVPTSNREFRRMVNAANKDGDCIINVGNGYYRPVPGDVVDERELAHYMASELHRAREILFKRLQMRSAFQHQVSLCSSQDVPEQQ